MQIEPSQVGKPFLNDVGHYQQLIENLPVAIYTCDVNGFIQQFNKAALELWGREPVIGADQWCGSWKIFRPDGTPLPIEACPMAIAIREGRAVTGQEIIIQRPDGVRYNVRPNPRPIFNASGQVIGAVNMLMDVTPWRSIEKKMQESEDRLRLATEGTQLATWDLNLQTREIIYSPRLAQIFGHPESKRLSYENMLAQIHPQDMHTIVDKAFDLAMQTGEYFYEARVVHPDKSIHWVRTNGKVLFDEKRTPTRMLGTMVDITEHWEVGEKIEKLAAIVQSSDDAIISKTLDGIITSWNAGAQRIFGYTQEEMIGQPMTTLFPPDRMNEEPEILRQLQQGHRVDHFETVRVTKDKKPLNVSLTISPIKDASGKVIGASKIARDITRQKLAEQIISANEERLQIVISASELGTWELNTKTGAVNYSKRYLEILGYPEETVLDHEQLLKHLHPDDREVRDQAFKNAYKTGQLGYVTRLILSDQSVHWVEAKGKVFYDEENQPLKIIGTIRDITREKLRQQELQDNEQRFRLLADSMPQFVWTGDKTGALNYFNQSVYNYSGLTREQIAKEGWIQIVHPDEREENIKSWLQSVATGRPFLFEHRFRRRDGEYRWQLSRAEPQRDAEGNIQLWVGTSTDIHDRKLFTDQLEVNVQQRTRELYQLNEDLVKSNIELGQFAYVASHDLQEPLRKIQSFSTRILELEADRLSDTGKEYFNRMLSATTRMKQLIIDLLSYSRAGTDERNFERAELKTILQAVIDQLKETIDQKQAVIKWTTLPSLYVIPYQFEQLLVNILSNALKFSKRDVPPVITITVDQVKGNAISQVAVQDLTYERISIKDNGIGFDPQYSARIFQVFQRLHGKDEYAGTGIGLSIVKKIVENHNGIVVTESEVGKGANFIVYIPVV